MSPTFVTNYYKTPKIPNYQLLINHLDQIAFTLNF